MLRVVLVFVLLLAASPVFAQVHPCDEPDSGTGTTSAAAVRVAFCHDGLDTQGRPAPLVGADVILDGGAPIDLAISEPSSGPNASGSRLYESAVPIPVAVGDHVLVVRVRNGFGTTSSPLFALTVSLSDPGAPIKIRVIEVPRPPAADDPHLR